jgi:hypothetical protein
MVPAMNDAIRMPSFAATNPESAVKAKLVMNRDVVRPIPASQPAPSMCFHDSKLSAIPFIFPPYGIENAATMI